MISNLLKLLSVTYLLSFSFFVFAQPSAPLSLPSLDEKVVIDGHIDESVWRRALKQTLRFQSWPNENESAPVKTEVWIYENGHHLFVAFKAYDPDPDKIYALFRDRDLVMSHDVVGLELDTFNDNRLAYQFFANPYGVQVDSVYNELTGDESNSWDATWQSMGRITEDGYEVEFALPLEVFNFEESDELKTWGVRFVRYYPRNERLMLTNVPYSRDVSCLLCQFGRITGFKNVSKGSDKVFSPFLVAGRQRERETQPLSDWNYDGRTDIGLDLKWSPSPEISLSGTINPDFSQVEADVAQLSVNKPFSLFFEEKRPFFLENADYFSTYNNVVYTRNISAPDFGAKGTARVDGHTLGIFVADDEDTTLVVPGNVGSSIGVIDEKSTGAALRYRYDYSPELSLGAVATLRESDNYHNYVYGADAQYDVTPQDTITVQALLSDTQYPVDFYTGFCGSDCDSPGGLSEAALRTRDSDINGSAYKVEYSHVEKDWQLEASRTAFDEEFRADLGYIPAIDSITDKVTGAYYWYEEDSWWNEIEARATWEQKESFDGELLEEEWDMVLILTGIYQTYFDVGYTKRDKVGLRHDPSSLAINGNTTLFDEHDWYTRLIIRPISTMYISQYFRTGDRIDFLNNRLGEDFVSQTRFFVNLGIHTTLDIHHTYQDFEVEQGGLFSASLTDARITYQFDKEQFIRLIFAYNDVSRNLDNYARPETVLETERDFGTQLLYSYKLNPFTKFFLGYSDFGIQNDISPQMRVSEQSLFMKVSYAWYN